MRSSMTERLRTDSNDRIIYFVTGKQTSQNRSANDLQARCLSALNYQNQLFCFKSRRQVWSLIGYNLLISIPL